MTLRYGPFAGWLARTGVLLLLLLATSGCGGGGPSGPTGTVKGIVTYKGHPVPEGIVTFLGQDNRSATAPLGEDGSYQASGVPVGVVQVTVTTGPPATVIAKAAKEAPHGRRFAVGNPITVPKNTVAVPAKYSSPAKSGISMTVSEGINNFDIALK